MRIRLLEPMWHPRFDDLPWDVPLDAWDVPRLVDLPTGLHRHVVRFVRYDDQVYALKEIGSAAARREFRLLRHLNREVLPVVRVVGLVDGRAGLDPVLVTRFLNYALPYRYLYRTATGDPSDELVSSIAGLLARLHLAGFYWGDCSLSNSLFRRDAGRLTAYALDTETGELHPRLTDGQRDHDLEIAYENVAGGLMDLSAAGELPGDLDPIDVADRLVAAYRGLWDELHGPEEYDVAAPEAIGARIGRLQALGFEVVEARITGDPAEGRMRFEPVEVVEGHHRRELQRLTGIIAQENQARRLLEDLRAHRARLEHVRGHPVGEEAAAHDWVAHVFEPVIETIPARLLRKTQPAQAFHEVLEHRSELEAVEGRTVDRLDAAASYVDRILAVRPDEKVVVED